MSLLWSWSLSSVWAILGVSPWWGEAVVLGIDAAIAVETIRVGADSQILFLGNFSNPIDDHRYVPVYGLHQLPLRVGVGQAAAMQKSVCRLVGHLTFSNPRTFQYRITTSTSVSVNPYTFF